MIERRTNYHAYLNIRYSVPEITSVRPYTITSNLDLPISPEWHHKNGEQRRKETSRSIRRYIGPTLAVTAASNIPVHEMAMHASPHFIYIFISSREGQVYTGNVHSGSMDRQSVASNRSRKHAFLQDVISVKLGRCRISRTVMVFGGLI